MKREEKKLVTSPADHFSVSQIGHVNHVLPNWLAKNEKSLSKKKKKELRISLTVENTYKFFFTISRTKRLNIWNRKISIEGKRCVYNWYDREKPDTCRRCRIQIWFVPDAQRETRISYIDSRQTIDVSFRHHNVIELVYNLALYL